MNDYIQLQDGVLLFVTNMQVGSFHGRLDLAYYLDEDCAGTMFLQRETGGSYKLGNAFYVPTTAAGALLFKSQRDVAGICSNTVAYQQSAIAAPYTLPAEIRDLVPPLEFGYFGN